MKTSKQAERRACDLRGIMRKGKRHIVLVIDQADKTVVGLRQLMEIGADAGVLLSVMLVGRPGRATTCATADGRDQL